jgi:4-amino-4-deoxy-L-arabinose transferase-like glycosyltransferase
MVNLSNRKNKIFLYIFLAILFIVLASLTISFSATDKPPSSDDDQYVSMGYNIFKYGTFSISREDKPEPEPTAYREPGYPAYIAAMMFLNPTLHDMNRAELYENGLKVLRYMQIPLVIIIAFLSMFIVVKITRNLAHGYFILFFTGSSIILNVTANHLLSENLIAVFLLLVSIFLFKIFEDKKLYYFILLGIACGLLALCRFTFMYLPIIIVILFIISLFTNLLEKKKETIAGILLFIMFFSIIMGSWMIRNYVHFDKFTNGGQGGLVLLVRARKNLMNYREYPASFLYWTPGGLKINEKILRGYFDVKDYERFNSKNEGSFIAIARKERLELVDIIREDGYSEQKAYIMADGELKKRALGEIFNNPFKHVLAILPFAWRGLFIETGYSYKLPGFLLTIEGGTFMIILNICLFFSFFYLFGLSIRKKSWKIFVILIPSVYLYIMNILVSHDKPRYNIPILPFLMISTLLILVHFMSRNKFIYNKFEIKKFLKKDK